MQDLPGRVAFVAGASDVEVEIARSLAAAGMKVVLADPSPARREAARSRLAIPEGDILLLDCEPGDRGAMREAAKAVVARFGKVHVLVSGGGGPATPLADLDAAGWDDAYAGNLGSLINLLQEFLPIVRGQKEGGRLLARVPLSSVIGGASDAGTVQGSATIAVMEALSAELRPDGVGCSILFASGDGSAGVGDRVVKALGAGDLYVSVDPVPAGAIHDYFNRLLEVMPESSEGAAPTDVDPAEMFPVYAAVLRAKDVGHKPDNLVQSEPGSRL